MAYMPIVRKKESSSNSGYIWYHRQNWLYSSDMLWCSLLVLYLPKGNMYECSGLAWFGWFSWSRSQVSKCFAAGTTPWQGAETSHQSDGWSPCQARKFNRKQQLIWYIFPDCSSDISRLFQPAVTICPTKGKVGWCMLAPGINKMGRFHMVSPTNHHWSRRMSPRDGFGEHRTSTHSVHLGMLAICI